MATRLSQANIMAGIIVNEAWVDDTAGVVMKDHIDAGNRFLYVVTDESVTVSIGDETYLAVPAYPLIVALNSNHYDKDVTFVAVA